MTIEFEQKNEYCWLVLDGKWKTGLAEICRSYDKIFLEVSGYSEFSLETLEAIVAKMKELQGD